MAQWIRTDHDFGLPAVTFTISVRQIAIARQVGQALIDFSEKNPEKLAEELEKLVGVYRPSLGDGRGSVVSIDMRGGFCFRVHFYHPSLKRVKMGEYPPEVSLIPQEGEINLVDPVADDVEIPGPTLIINNKDVGWNNR